ncbi:hypothetical protein ABZ820_40960 [Streptomyces diacarni]|uniref:hypothetical protein n=1 Tax=Streptomyces diacarni TaxID=2800381 RepID=UPI0033CA5678
MVEHGLPFFLLGECSGAYIAWELGRTPEHAGRYTEALLVLRQVAPVAYDRSVTFAELPGLALPPGAAG